MRWKSCLPPFGFNSRTLGGVRREIAPTGRLSWRGFNSRTLGRVRLNFIPIQFVIHSSFNSRTLGRVRLKVIARLTAEYEFQFTHPGKGATSLTLVVQSLSYVSIHAPWEGCDCNTSFASRRRVCFNSRTLGRVRRNSGVTIDDKHTSFNSRTLGRVRLRAVRVRHERACFNSRTLGRVRPI